MAQDESASKAEVANLRDDSNYFRAKLEGLTESMSGFREEVAQDRGRNDARWEQSAGDLKDIKNNLSNYQKWFMGLFAAVLAAILVGWLKG